MGFRAVVDVGIVDKWRILANGGLIYPLGSSSRAIPTFDRPWDLVMRQLPVNTYVARFLRVQYLAM